EQLTAALLELRLMLGEAEHLGGTNEGEIQRIKQQVDPLAAVGLQAEGVELAVEVAFHREVGGGFANETHDLTSSSVIFRRGARRRTQASLPGRRVKPWL